MNLTTLTQTIEDAVQGSLAETVRDDSGSTLGEAVVSMTITALLMSSVVGLLWMSVNLVRAAPSDTNPTVYGALTTSVARLEGSLFAPLSCGNPSGEPTRTECLTVETLVPEPVPHPDTTRAPSEDGTCWVVNDDTALTIDKRRLECWELLDHGDLVAYTHVHAEPDPSTPDPDDVLADTSDLLSISVWKAVSEPFRGRAFGLEALRWDTPDKRLHACARIRPDQRQTMEPDEVPYCEDLGVPHGDGSQGVLLGDGTRGVDLGDGNPPVACTDSLVAQRWVCREGYRLPAVRFDPAGV